MAENVQQQQQQEAAVQKQAKKSAVRGTAGLCKHCGAALDPELAFCTECGEKIGGEEHTCQFCQTRTANEFCSHCGSRVIPVPCPKCGTPSFYDACENCGALLNPALEKALAQESSAEIAVMSDEEAERIQAEFRAVEANESAEFRAFRKKLVEHQILLEEKDYFNKREKRIVKAFGSSPFTLELPDPAEESFRMKAYAALEKTIIEREEREIEAELEKLFPPVAEIPAEDPGIAELERKFNEALAKVNQEVDSFRREEERKRLEAERKRLEEERRKEEERRREAERQRQMEIERRRLEEERRKKRFNGNYSYRNPDGTVTAELSIKGNQACCWYRCTCNHTATIVYSVSINGDNIILSGGRKNGNSCSFPEYSLVENYSGTVSNSGTILNGRWHSYGSSMPIVFYKR